MSRGISCERKRKKITRKFHEQKGLCYYCERPMLLAKGAPDARLLPHQATVDHIVPRANGGTFANDNIVGACFKCNNERGTRDARLFMLEKQGVLA